MFFSLLKLTNIMTEEYQEEYHDDVDPSTRLAFLQSFKGMKSESVDYAVEHSESHPLSIAFFYDSRDMDEEITRYLSKQLLQIYAIKSDENKK